MRYLISILFFLQFGIAIAQTPELVLPVAHSEEIRAAKFSHDGKIFITGGSDKMVNVWETASGKKLHALGGNTNQVKKIFFTNDGKYLVAGTDSSMLVWSVPDYHLVATIGNTRKVIFSAANDIVYVAGHDRLVRAFSFPAMKPIKTFDDSLAALSPNFAFDVMDLSTDGSKLAWLMPGGYTVHETSSGRRLFYDSARVITPTVTEEFNAVIFSGNEHLFVHGNINMKRTNLQSGKVEVLGSGNERFALSDNRKFLLGLSFDNFHDRPLWDLVNGEKIGSLSGASIYDTLISTNEKGENQLVVGTMPASSYNLGHYFNGMQLSNDGRLAFGMKNMYNLHDLDSSYDMDEISLLKWTSFSDDNRFIGVQLATGEAALWDIGKRKIVQRYSTGVEPIRRAMIDANGKKILMAGESSVAQVISSSTGRLLFELKGHRAKILSAVFNPAGTEILTHSEDSTARLWSAIDGKLIKEFKNKNWYHTPGFFTADNQIHFSPPLIDSVEKYDDVGNVIGMVVVPREILHPSDIPSSYTHQSMPGWKLLDWGVTILLGTKLDVSFNIFTTAFSPSDSLIAISGSTEDSLLIGNRKTGEWLYRRIPDISSRDNYGGRGIEQMIFTPDEKYLVIVDQNSTIHIMRLEDFSIVKRLPGQNASLSKDGRLLVVVNQGKCDVYDFGNWRLLYTYINVKGKDFLAVDEQQRYDGTEAARKLLYYSCGNEVIDLEQFKDKLWVPNLVERLMMHDSIQSPTISQLSICGYSPTIEEGRGANGNREFRINAGSGGLGETVVYVNGIEVKRYQPSELQKQGDMWMLNINQQAIEPYFANGMENVLSVRSFAADNMVSSRGFSVKDTSRVAMQSEPDLYAVFVGVSDYKGEDLDLKYADKDATDLSNAVSAAARKLLNTTGSEHVFTYNLTTSANHYRLPEKMAIKQLLTEIGEKATTDDILLIFFAGHGIMQGNQKQFYFLPADVSSAGLNGDVAEIGISTTELTDWIKPARIKAQKRILVFDACNSGQAIKDFVTMGNAGQDYTAARSDDKSAQVKEIDKLNERSGLFILSAAASNQGAYEMGRYSQGLLTYALLKAIKQQPDILQNGKYLDVSRWFHAAAATVEQVAGETGARQQPQVISNTDFVIGMVDADVLSGIHLPMEKPVFTASVFFNGTASDDDLELSRQVNLELSDMSTRSADASFMYVMATNDPGAYSMTGKYLVTGDKVTVSVNIKRQKKIQQQFTVTGNKSNISLLSRQIVEKAAKLIK